VLCVSLSLISKWYYKCSTLFATKKCCLSCSWEEPPPVQTTLRLASKTFKKIYYHVLVLVFLALVCFTLEFTHAHLMEPHSLTARPTQVSLCTCLCQKKVYCLFTQTRSSLTFLLETLSKILIKFSPAQPRSHLGWWSLFFPGSSNFFLCKSCCGLIIRISISSNDSAPLSGYML
jgi:hypothetical protein